MKKLSIVLSLAIVAIWSSTTMAAFQTPDIRLDTGDPLGASNSNFLQVCSATDGHVYSAWVDYRNGPNGEIFFNSSSDFGQTWLSNPISLANLDTNHRGFNLDCTNNGHVYIAYAYCFGACAISFLESSNNGTSWNLWAPVNNGVLTDDPGIDPTPRICSTDNGSIHVVWEDNRRYEFGPTSESDIWYSGTSGYGRLNTWDADSFNPSISCTENGHVYVVWQVSAGFGLNDLVFNQSGDNGWNWQPSAVHIDEGWGNSDASDKVICSNEAGSVYIAWSDNRNVRYNPYLNRSTDYGATWQPTDIRLNTGDVAGAHNSYLGGIGCTTNGYVYAAYADRRNVTNYDIYFNYSSDNGATWQNPDVRVDNGDSPGQYLSTNVQIANDDVGNVYASFMDARNGGWDILFSKSLDHGATWFSNPERVNTGSPLGSGAAWFQKILLGPSGRVYIAWQDERTVPGVYDIYFNYWTATFGMTPTLSEFAMVFLGIMLLFSLFLIVRKNARKAH